MLKWKEQALKDEGDLGKKQTMQAEYDALKHEYEQVETDVTRAQGDADNIAREDAKEAEHEKAKAKAEERKNQDKTQGNALKRAF